MRFIFLPEGLTILLFFIIWPAIQVGSAIFCLKMPDRFFKSNKGIYSSKKFEQNGKFYEKVFKVKKWKHLLPDGGALYKKKGYAKKKLTDFSDENLNKFLVESCRAELTHWLPIFFSWIFFFITTPFIVLLMFVYSLIVNMPCILVQRYNRPRIEKLIKQKYGR